MAMDNTEGLQDEFHRLVEKLSVVLEPSSGQSFHDVDPQVIVEAMRQYTSSPSDWEKYAWGANDRGYTRNLVHKGNGKSNLLILVWSPGKGSPVHDHANSHCVMKILQGSLCETQCEWPDEEAIKAGRASPLKAQKTSKYEENEVTYISDELGLHRIYNLDPERRAVSLHRTFNEMELGRHSD
ncbi:MAG: hypothetical protein M1831_000269 [Alyxoria varia]|nr:MAG: hypothetical protein M1831_000269 [Alyxoria varia]